MPLVPKLKLSGKLSRSTTDSDSHNVTVSDTNRYDQHYHSSSSGNVTKTVVNKDESDRSIVKTSDKSYNITTNIINNSSHFQMPPSSAGLPVNYPEVLPPPMYANYPVATEPYGPITYGPPTVQPTMHPFVNYPHPPALMAQQSQEEKNVTPELELEILCSKMSPEMEESATNSVLLAFIKEKDAMNRAKYISDYFEKYYGSSWHCVVGSEFGNLVRYQEDLYIHLRVANQRVIIFKTPIITAEAEMKRFQEKVQQATLALEALVTMYEAIETYRNKMDEICSSTLTSIEHLSEEHEKQQKNITQEFTEDWHKKFKSDEQNLKVCLDLIIEKSNKIYSTYEKRERERIKVKKDEEEQRSEVCCQEQEDVLVPKLNETIQTTSAGGAVWVAASNGEVPEGAVSGGTDHHCKKLFVARALHEGDLLPGKLNPSKGACFVCCDGIQHSKDVYEVLCHMNLTWVQVKKGEKIPENALPGGRTSDGEILFVGRVPHKGTITIGKVHPSHALCYIPYDGEEHGFPDYELLVQGDSKISSRDFQFEQKLSMLNQEAKLLRKKSKKKMF